MIERIDVGDGLGLDDYAAVAHLSQAVAELRAQAALEVPALAGRTVWMVNSTAKGGGVAEMLPRMVRILEELGVKTRWVVIGSDEPAFFELTKRIHNLVHGVGEPHLRREDRRLFERVSRENADGLAKLVGKDDILVVHDPQPAGSGAMLKESLGLTSVWRCHIGLDEHGPATRAVWRFLEPWVTAYDRAVFSAPEYIPSFLAGRATVLHPAIDPLGHKSRELPPHKLMGVLVNAELARAHAPVLTPPFEHSARRLGRDGRFVKATEWDELGLVYRPTVLQVSRFDRLKGFGPLLEAFVRLKEKQASTREPRHRRRLGLLRLVLAGPDPEGVSDDPEAIEVLAELAEAYRALPEKIQEDVAVIALPMASRKENALMVNALQRCATVVVQNSLREGFGLTATEAMWKRVPVVVSNACGLRQQVRDGLDGRIVGDGTDPVALAEVLDEVLADSALRDRLARTAQRRVHDEFLVFTQVRRWLEVLSRAVPTAVGAPKAGG